MANGDVTCRQIGCGHAVSAPSSAHFGRGSGPIWLDNVACSGQESALAHCPHNPVGENNCGHGEDAGVICLGRCSVLSFVFCSGYREKQTHVLSPSSVSGALEKPKISVSPSSDVNWGDKLEITCSVVTEHLGGTFVLKRAHSTFKMQKYSENEVATFIFPKVDFSHRGSYFCEYQKKLSNQVVNYPQGHVAELTVEGMTRVLFVHSDDHGESDEYSNQNPPLFLQYNWRSPESPCPLLTPWWSTPPTKYRSTGAAASPSSAPPFPNIPEVTSIWHDRTRTSAKRSQRMATPSFTGPPLTSHR